MMLTVFQLSNSFQNQIKKLIAGPVFVKRIRQVRKHVNIVIATMPRTFTIIQLDNNM